VYLARQADGGIQTGSRSRAAAVGPVAALTAVWIIFMAGLGWAVAGAGRPPASQHEAARQFVHATLPTPSNPAATEVPVCDRDGFDAILGWQQELTAAQARAGAPVHVEVASYDRILGETRPVRATVAIAATVGDGGATQRLTRSFTFTFTSTFAAGWWVCAATPLE
jgi:hypothetical protein